MSFKRLALLFTLFLTTITTPMVSRKRGEAKELENKAITLINRGSAVRFEKIPVEEKITKLQDLQQAVKEIIEQLQPINPKAAKRVQQLYTEGYITRILPALIKEIDQKKAIIGKPTLPSAPQAPLVPLPKLTPPSAPPEPIVPELRDFPGIANQAGFFNLPLALEIVEAELQRGTLDQEPIKEPLILVLEKLLLPYVLKSFSATNPQNEHDKALRLKQINQIASPAMKQFVNRLNLRNATIPVTGEFSDTAQKALDSWVNKVKKTYPEALPHFKKAINHIDTIFTVPRKRLSPTISEVEENIARILFLARLIDKSPIISLVDGLELE